MAHFDRAIPPGGEGKITLKVNTKGYEGKFRKSARAYSNDPRRPLESIRIEAFVKTPIHLSPRYVFLQGLRTEKITKTVTVKAELDKPLKIEPIRFTLDKWVDYKIEEVQEGKIFQVHFTNIPETNTQYHGFLRLKTNYNEKPELFIRVRGRFKN